MEMITKHFSELTTEELYEILRTREEIFVVEQNCAYQDIDGKDTEAVHIFCMGDSGRVAACLRVFWRDRTLGVAQIGRVVTLEHGQGLGGRLLNAGVRFAEEEMRAAEIYIEAQEYAIGYYAREGFEVVSEPFLEDGIPHVKMIKHIS